MKNQPSPSSRPAWRASLLLAASLAIGCSALGLQSKSLSMSSGGDSASESAESGGGGRSGGKSIGQLELPDPKAALSSWTAVQQWRANRDWGAGYGYDSLAGGAALADELGGKLSELGRASWIRKCLGNHEPDASAALAWAICGSDVAALDLEKLESELGGGGLSEESRQEVLAEVRTDLEDAKKVGEAVGAAAKDDPGIEAMLQRSSEARKEWAAYAAANKDRIALFLKLKDAVRSGKSNAAGFSGCYEATQPAFAKLVRAAKLPVEDASAPLLSYAGRINKSIDDYLVSASFGACAYAQHKSGEALFAALAEVPGGRARFGARSLALAKLLDASFTPRFADRSVDFARMTFEWRYGMEVPTVLSAVADLVPKAGIVEGVQPEGDNVVISFKSAMVEMCIEWRDSDRIERVDGDGKVRYQQECKRRGKVETQTDPATTNAKFAGGIAPGLQLITVNGFPVMVSKGKRLIAALGVTMN